MGLTHSPNVTTRGLVLCLDAANSRSYPGSGNSWLDLSGNNNNGVLQNSPTFNTDSRDFNFDGSNQYVSVNNVPSISTNDFTCEILAKIQAEAGTRYYFGNWGYNGGNQIGFWFARPSWNVNAVVFSSYDTDNHTAINSGNISVFVLNKYQHFIITRSGTSYNMYLNGNNIRSFSSSTTLKYDRTYMNIHHAGDGSTYSYGSTKFFRMYINKALSPNEVRQNYLATKGRFNL